MSDSRETPRLRVTDLTKSFGNKMILHNVSFQLAKGSSLVIIGGSGSGKSVLIKCISGLYALDQGQIEVDEFSLRKWLRAGDWPVPHTQNLERFSRLSINTGIKLSSEMMSLRPFSLMLDETSIDGRIDLSLRPLNVDLELLADKLNLDSYLSSNPSAQTGSSAMPFPLMTGTYKLDVGELTVSKHLLNQVGFDLGIGSDEITLGRLDANLFGGELRLAGTHLIITKGNVCREQ